MRREQDPPLDPNKDEGPVSPGETGSPEGMMTRLTAVAMLSVAR